MNRFFYIPAILTAAMVLSGCSQKAVLFNGNNLDGWKPYLAESTVRTQDVWSIQDSVLQCKGKPTGYLRSEQTFADYTLYLEWRWTDKPGNSGVLLHATGNDVIWPMCIEAQLMNQNAGDFVTIQQGSVITVNGKTHQPPADKMYQIVSKQQPSSEKPAGQWNTYKIVCRGDTIKLYVNGILQNSAVNVSPSAGAICLQSEGAPIEFRNIYLVPLK